MTGTTNITVTGVGAGLTRTVGVSLTVNSASRPRRTSPSARTRRAGRSPRARRTTYAITINPTGGFNSSVTLSTSALPTGVSASFTHQPDHR